MSDEELTLEEQLERATKALDRYKKENKKFREERDSYKEQLDSAGTDENIAQWKSRVVAAEAKLKLASEGIKDSDRLVKRMNLDSVSLNDEGELEGLDDQIGELKNDFPELFDNKKRVGGGADGSNRGDLPESSPTQAAVSRLFHGR